MTIYTPADPSKVLIVDLSKWQDDPTNSILPDFQKMISRGVSGVIIKCGEGSVWDRAFEQYVNILKSLNIPYGMYWYYNNYYKPNVQAKVFQQAVEKFGYPPLGLWGDFEDRKPGQYGGWRNWYNFLFDLEVANPNKLIGIYTGYYYWVEFTKWVGIPQASLNWFGKFPLWIAAYGGSPQIPKPWTKWTIWQFTDLLDGEWYGVESKELDGNYFYGTFDEYKTFFKLDTVSTPPDDTNEEPQMEEYEVTVVWDLGASTKIAPNVGGINYKTWKKGEVFYASELVRDSLDPINTQKMWAKLSRGEHTGKYVAVLYPSSSGNPVRCTYKKLVPDTPPGEVTLTHTIEVFSDGSIKLDGQPV